MLKSKLGCRCALGLIVIALLVNGTPACAEDTTASSPPQLKISAAVGPAYALGAAAANWAKRITEKSQGRYAAKLFPGAMLAARDPAREFTALHDAAADLAVGSTLYWSIQVPALTVAALPWLAPERAQLEALVRSPVASEWASAIDNAGVVPLAFAPLAHRGFAARARAIHAPGELAGLKVRVTDAPVLTALYAAFGAQPLTMSFADSQAAFLAGTLDLQDGTAASFAGAHLDAVGVKQVVLWGAVAEVAVFAVNRGRWETWNQTDRALIKSTAEESAHELATLARQEEESAITRLRKSGIEVVRLNAAERARFAAAVKSTYDKFAAAAGMALVQAAEAEVRRVAR